MWKVLTTSFWLFFMVFIYDFNLCTSGEAEWFQEEGIEVEW